MTWRIFDMYELWELLATEEQKKIFGKPKFPTRRWGDITNEKSTTDRNSIIKGMEILKSKNIKCRKRIDHFNTNKFKHKKFYFIEILCSPERRIP